MGLGNIRALLKFDINVFDEHFETCITGIHSFLVSLQYHEPEKYGWILNANQQQSLP